MHAKQSQQHNITLSRNVSGNKHNDAAGCLEGGSTVPQFHFDDFSETEKRRHVKTNIQFKKSQQIRYGTKISSYKHSSCARLPPVTRLDGKNRFPPGIFPSKGSSRSSSIFTPNLQEKTYGNDVPTVRSQFSPENFCIHIQLDRTEAPRRRCPHTGISGRFLLGAPEPRHLAGPCDQNCKTAGKSGLEYQQTKIYSKTTESSGVSGNCLGQLEQYKISPRENSRQNTKPAPCDNQQRPSFHLRVAASGRHYEFCQFCHTEGEAKLSSHSKTGQHAAKATNNKITPIAKKCTCRVEMVGTELQEDFTNTCVSPYALPNNGCERHRLGSEVRPREFGRNMDSVRTEPSLQPKRNDCHTKRLARSWSAPELEGFTHPVRQPNGSLLLAQRGGDQVYSVNEPDNEGIPVNRPLQHPNVYLSHSRQLQSKRRPPITPQGSTGVAPVTPINAGNIPKVGNSVSRSVCVSNGTCSGELLLSRQVRPTSILSRCLESNVGLSPSLGVPAPVFDPQSARSPEYSQRSIPDRSAKVGQSVLETRPEEQSNCSPVHSQESQPCPSRRDDRPSTSKSIGDDTGNLEMWGWNQHLTGWSDSQKRLLSSSWRESTMRTYKPAWRRWTVWSSKNGIDPFQPSGSQLARFLADLHQVDGLSLSTILVHKSVVSTFCNPNLETKLSSHTLVKQVLKSIALAKPKRIKPPIWDVDVLTNYISKKDPNPKSLYEVSKFTAAILLLCSGRRVHDLTLLKISPEYCTIEQDVIILRPVFGSKTDNATHQQSGWKLMRNTNNLSLDPVHWVKLLIKLSGSRRELVKTDFLFLTTAGEAKAASRTVISGWIKKLLHEAGISGTPGSFRSAVASKNWVENFSLDDILERGNWKSANTFRKFYCRDIITRRPNNQTLISSLFTPTNTT